MVRGYRSCFRSQKLVSQPNLAQHSPPKAVPLAYERGKIDALQQLGQKRDHRPLHCHTPT